MNRYAMTVCLSLVACAGASRAGAPPVAPAVRSLTLAEAAKHALEHRGYRVERGDAGSLRVSHPSRPEPLEAFVKPFSVSSAPSATASPCDPLEVLRTANQLLLNVEVAYWNLYQGQKALSARKQAVQSSLELLRLCKSRHAEGTASKEDVSLAREQYRTLRKQCGEFADAESEYERQLVALTGLEAGSRLRTSDRPSVTRERPDWDAALQVALAKRPELRMARKDVFFARTILWAERIVEALLGVPSTVPLKLQLVRAIEVRNDQEGKAQNFLELYYRRLNLNYKQIQSTRAQREAFGELLTARKVQYASGRCSLAALLEAQRSCADAQASEYAAIGTYNNARAGFDYGKGTTLDRHRMVFGQR